MSAKLGRITALSLIPLALALGGCETSDGGAPAGGVATQLPASGVSDLVGARGSSGELELQNRGFVPAVTRGLTTYWWNGASASCVEVVTGNGRYQSVRYVASSSCGY